MLQSLEVLHRRLQLAPVYVFEAGACAIVEFECLRTTLENSFMELLRDRPQDVSRRRMTCGRMENYGMNEMQGSWRRRQLPRLPAREPGVFAFEEV